MAEVPRSGRLATLRQLLAEGRYGSQGELSDALTALGISVSQSTLSKDLVTLAAIRQRTPDGSLVYALSPREHEDAVVQRLAQLCSELLQSVRHAGNQILVRVPPGAAQYFASYLDRAELGGVMGTIAGDDTVLVIATDEEAAEAVVDRLTALRDGRSAPSSGTALRDGRSAPSSGTALRDGRFAPSSGTTLRDGRSAPSSGTQRDHETKERHDRN